MHQLMGNMNLALFIAGVILALAVIVVILAADAKSHLFCKAVNDPGKLNTSNESLDSKEVVVADSPATVESKPELTLEQKFKNYRNYIRENRTNRYSSSDYKFNHYPYELIKEVAGFRALYPNGAGVAGAIGYFIVDTEDLVHKGIISWLGSDSDRFLDDSFYLTPEEISRLKRVDVVLVSHFSENHKTHGADDYKAQVYLTRTFINVEEGQYGICDAEKQCEESTQIKYCNIPDSKLRNLFLADYINAKKSEFSEHIEAFETHEEETRIAAENYKRYLLTTNNLAKRMKLRRSSAIINNSQGYPVARHLL